MKTVIVWVMFVFHGNGSGMPTAGIFTYATESECKADSLTWRQSSCVKVEVPKK
jgi:hypothetical protein